MWQGLTDDVRERTLLIATQRRRIAARADRVVLLEAGRIVAEGSDEQLWRTTALYRQIMSSGDD